MNRIGFIVPSVCSPLAQSVALVSGTVTIVRPDLAVVPDITTSTTRLQMKKNKQE
jgi:hypothetical protein